ncbi:hypothetical protein GTV32_02760 [Gordonia sp. SID5947]|uniref:phage tail protein n=1 Tax=Gordonia sp. SID5947 TaxID=2690315 RepID=UPI00136B86FC|nr:hypothetical protein [Gordonia sp. SID5947]MYR05306.1 hypothetical protein [Gordonia sp. SID5947]
MAQGKEVGRVSVRVMPDTSHFRRDTDRSLKRATKGLKVKVPVKLKTKNLRADMEKATAGLDDKVKVKVGVSSQHTRASLRALAAELRLIARREKVEIPVEIDQKTSRDAIGGMSRMSQQLSRMRGAADGASRSFRGLGGSGGSMGLIAVAVAALIAPLTGLVSSLLAGLPSLLGAVGAAAGVTYLGFDGIKKAAEALNPVLDHLKTSISGVFERGLTSQFEAFSKTLGKMEPSLSRIAEGMLDVSGAFFKVVNSQAGMSAMRGILDNTATLMTRLAPGVETLTSGFLKLASEGSAAFGYLADAFGTFANGFGAVVDRLASSGALDSAMKGLSEVVTGLGNAFNTLFESGVKVMGSMGGPIRSTIEGLANSLAAAMPGLAAFSNAILKTAGSFLNALAPAIEKMQPALVKFYDSMGNLWSGLATKMAPVLTEVAGILSDSLLSVMNQLAPVLPQIVEGFGQMATAFAGALADNAPKIADSMAKLGIALGDAAVKLAPLMPQLVQMAVNLIPKLVAVMPQLVDSFVNFSTNALPQITTGIITLAPYVLTILNGFTQWVGVVAQVTGVLGGLQPVMSGVVSLFKIILGPLGSAINIFKITATQVGILKGAFSNAGNVISGVIDTLSNAFDKFKEAVSVSLDAVKQIVTDTKDKIVSTFSSIDLTAIGAQIMQGLLNGLKSVPVLGTVISIAGGIKNAFKSVLGIHSPSKVFHGYGMNIVQGLTNGLSNTTPVENATKKLADSVKKTWDDTISQDLIASGKSIAQAPFQTLASDLGFSSSGVVGSLISQFINGSVTPNPKEQEGSGATYIVKDIDEAKRKEDLEKKKKSLQFKKR